MAIGNTPIVRLNKLTNGLEGEVYVKLEFMNPLSSVKDRPALYMILDAESRGLLKQGDSLVEPTSGNMGIALAYICSQRGYKAILTMPETMSEERKALLRMLGAELVLTDGKLGMKGAIDKAMEISYSRKYFMPMQFENPANVEAHRATTAQEIWKDMEGDIDAFVSGVGTGGTFSGVVGMINSLKKIYAVAVEPSLSPVISGGKAGSHMIQGIGAGFIPKNLNTSLIDEVIQVSNDDAINTAKQMSILEGIPVGISSGANIYASLCIAKKPEFKNKKIVTVAASCAERYISTALGKI